jgi:predicted MFS family arabinose efflux permease
VLRSIASAYREAYSGLPRTVWLLSTATLVNRAGTMVLPFLALFLTLKRGYTTPEAGELLALYGIGGMGAAFLGGWLTDRFPPRQVMLGSLVLNGIGFLFLGRLQARWAIALVILAVSLAGEAFRPASQAAVTAASTPETRARSFALHRLAVNLGMSVGPAVGGFLARYDYGWLFLTDGVTCLLAAGLLASLRLPEAHAVPQPVPATTELTVAGAAAPIPAERSPWRDGPYLLQMFLVFILAVVVFQTLSTYMLTLHDEYGFSEDRIGLLLAINTLIIVAVEMVLIHTLRDKPVLPLVGFGSFLFCAGLALLPFGSSFLWVAGTICVWTLGEMISFPLSSTAATARAGSRNLGAYMGIYTFAWQAAFVVAPLVGTWVYQEWGSRTLWLGCGALGVLIWAGFQGLALREAREKRG